MVVTLIKENKFDFVPASTLERFPHIGVILTRVNELAVVQRYRQGRDQPAPEVAAETGMRTFADHQALGKPAPGLEGLDFVGRVPRPGPGPVLVMFWAHFAEGEYCNMVQLDDLLGRVPGLHGIGVSLDADRGAVERFEALRGYTLPAQGVQELRVAYALAFDEGRQFKRAVQQVTGLGSIAPSTVLLIDGGGDVVWFERFDARHTLQSGQLSEQARRLVAGEALISNGPNPRAADHVDGSGGDIEMDMGEVDTDDSDGLIL